MQKEIIYSGFSTVPSDHDTVDGTLATSLNLINHDGALHPIPAPDVVLTLPNPLYYVIFIHKTTAFTHYIIAHRVEKSLWWIPEGIPNPTLSDFRHIHTFDSPVTAIQSIGNTLIAINEQGMHYMLWKGEDSDYKYLGQHLPECELNFGLQSEFRRFPIFDYEYQIRVNLKRVMDGTFPFSTEEKLKATNEILGSVNKFIKENGSDRGRFVYPFLVRYAYRLYDGSLSMHSAPVLMLCCNTTMPRIRATNCDDDSHGDIYAATLRIMGMFHQLDFICRTSRATLEEWKDIIRSVDIFISQPFYTYDQSGTIEPYILDNFWDVEETRDSLFSVGRVTTFYPPNISYGKNNFWDCYDNYLANVDRMLARPDGDRDIHDGDECGWPKPFYHHMPLPSKKLSTVMDEITSCSTFYFLKSYSFDELPYEYRKIVDVPEDYLGSLLTREVMTDDYQTHDTLIPSVLQTYNSRLHAADVKRVPFKGFPPYSMFQHANASPTQYIRLYVHIRSDNGDIVVSKDNSLTPYNQNTPLLWFFYPDSNAYKVTLEVSGSSYYELPLKTHPTLNGAYWFGPWEGAITPERVTYDSPVVTSDENCIIPASNKVYASEANNPFFFPLSGIESVGTGQILGLASATKALSEGQFGQFPLYAFTTEGVWALEVSSTGTYSSRQPVTRDVCINPLSITPIDTAVLFATDRGIMIISGSQTQCISEAINAEACFNILTLPSLAKFLDNAIELKQDVCEIASRNPVTYFPYPAPFTRIYRNMMLLYDYVHQRVLAYLPEGYNGGETKVPCYIYSLKTSSWGMAQYDIVSGVNSYPEAYAMDSLGNLLNFSARTSKTVRPQLAVTRPIALDDPYSFKTVNTVVQRGMFRRGSLKTALYGSRDLFHWHLVSSSLNHELRNFRGTPYKYFRIIIIADLMADESIHSGSFAYIPRFQNKLR